MISLIPRAHSHSHHTPPDLLTYTQGPAIAPMRALVLDGDGATLVMGRRHWGLVRESGLHRLVEVAPHAWRAFEFNLGHMVAEVGSSHTRPVPCHPPTPAWPNLVMTSLLPCRADVASSRTHYDGYSTNKKNRCPAW